ncbi:MAG: DoxX family membrane protein [Bdellovibrionales bacterium]
MLVAFFESIKYSGHLVPISFLRIFVGYYYLQSFLAKFSGDFLVRPRVAEMISQNLMTSQAPEWMKWILNTYMVVHWQGFAFSLVAFELAIAVSYIVGYVVRPTALLGAFLTVFMIYLNPAASQDFFKILLATHVTFAWLGAGRCLGLDYYYFKRVRGVWW